MKDTNPIELKCEKCETGYTKPAEFKEWGKRAAGVFFRWSLMYCDKCRREREREALKRLPETISKIYQATEKE